MSDGISQGYREAEQAEEFEKSCRFIKDLEVEFFISENKLATTLTSPDSGIRLAGELINQMRNKGILNKTEIELLNFVSADKKRFHLSREWSDWRKNNYWMLNCYPTSFSEIDLKTLLLKTILFDKWLDTDQGKLALERYEH